MVSFLFQDADELWRIILAASTDCKW
jgi:hypothetical protein